MFRASPDSSQIDLLSHIEQFLRQRDQEKLNDPVAWHNVFLDQVTKRIPEERFSLLFDEENGRPNAPIRVLVAMLILKEGFGWSDEQLFEAIHFNLLVRRALGFLNLTDEAPVESTYYLFKQRLYAQQLATGVNLLHEVFQELTGEQAKRLGVVGEKLRMDSTLLDSNLATCTRLQLIIACLQVFWKSLSDEQKSWLDESDRALLDGLCAKRASQLIYGMEETTKQARLEEFGELLVRLHRSYSAQSSDRYELIERLLLEQYQLDGEGEEQRVVLKPACEISADSLQSPHDEEAAYRKKKDETVHGYSTNVTETCDEQLNLIVDVQTEPATTADNAYLKEAVDNSEAVLDGPVREISADGAYYSEENEQYAEERDKEIHFTGFPGKKGRYDYERSEAGVVVIDSKSGERQTAEEYKPGRYRFRVNGKWRYITDKDIDAAERRRRTENLPRQLFNRRCNVEATIFQLCYHTRRKKLKYRGKFRAQLWAICRAAWINMSRIANYQANQAEASA
jgi:hypothetical protein